MKLKSFSILLITILLLNVVQSREPYNPEDISVTQKDVQPSTITKGKNAVTVLTLSNNGPLNNKIKISSKNNGSLEEEPLIDRILTNNCSNHISIDDFDVKVGNDFKTDKGYRLPPGKLINFNWVLDTNTNSTLDEESTCSLDLQAPFFYSVNAFKQIQILESENLEPDSRLNSKSSKGPMNLKIQTYESTSTRSNIYYQGDSASISVIFSNPQIEGDSYMGSIRIQEIDIDSKNLSPNCGNLEQKWIGEGESRSIECNLEYDLGQKSSLAGEVQASVNYTYIRDLGTEKLSIEPNISKPSRRLNKVESDGKSWIDEFLYRIIKILDGLIHIIYEPFA